MMKRLLTAMLLATLGLLAGCEPGPVGDTDLGAELEERTDDLHLYSGNMTGMSDITHSGWANERGVERGMTNNSGQWCQVGGISYYWYFDGVGAPGCTYNPSQGVPHCSPNPYPINGWMCIDYLGANQCVQVVSGEVRSAGSGTTNAWAGRVWGAGAYAKVSFWFHVVGSGAVLPQPLQFSNAMVYFNCVGLQ